MNERPIVVVGLGFLGRGIVACLVSHGFRVIGYDRADERLARADVAIDDAIQELVAHEASEPSLRSAWREHYRGTTSLAHLAEASFVIESVVEDAAIKAALFDRLEQVIADDVPVASNTSAIPISLLQETRRRPERFLGMHWAEPAHATRFLELIRGEQTGDAAFERAVELARHCGKEPSFVNRDVPGFIANRLGYAMFREALHLLESGVADAETIDRSFRNSVGLWASLCGPFRWIDLTGGPALYAKAMGPVLPDLDRGESVPPPLQTLAADDAQGVLNGRGFYSYTPDQAGEWERLLRRHAWELKKIIDRERPLESPE
jgi:3-hydroxybutyryl-CoA dehydrogenase